MALNLLFPVADDGSLLNYADERKDVDIYGRHINWKPKYIIKEPMILTDLYRGRNVLHFHFQQYGEKSKFVVSAKGLLDTIRLGRFDGDIARGPWTFAKQGTSYFLVPA